MSASIFDRMYERSILGDITHASTAATSPNILTRDMIAGMRDIARNLPPAPPPIFVSPLLPMPATPKKRLKERRWHRRESGQGYAKRVQKKWTKIHGMGEPTHCIQTQQGIFMSASYYDRFEKATRAREALAARGSV